MRGLRANPARAVELYALLFSSRFWAFVTYTQANPQDPFFLIYESADGIRELPVFTRSDPKLAGHFASLHVPPQTVEFAGPLLWPKLLEVLKHGTAQVEVDPGEAHGIRLTRPMILGMVNKYGHEPEA